MAKKDFMTLEGIGKENKGSIYRNYKDDTDGILYFEDRRNNLLIRQIVPIAKDVELVRSTQRIAAQQYVLVSKDRRQFISLDKVMAEYTDEELKKKIRESNPLVNGEGAMTVAIFNLKTKEFIAILDIEEAQNTDGKIGAITFTFSNNMVIRNRYGQKIRRWTEKFLKETHIYTGGCREAIFNGNEYELVPIS